MGGDSGAMVGLILLGVLFLSKPRKTTLNGLINGGAPAYWGPLPETETEAEALTTELIRTRKIIVHRTVVTVPTIPTPTQIDTARDRIQRIDENIPEFVKKKWGKEAVQTPGWMPKGEV